jgi:type II secretory pathway pseudopilin PulG
MLGRMRRQAGDTLIEVLFAVTVFSFVVVSTLGIMNQGTAASQRSLEITLVRQQIDAQAETLRFMHDSYVSVYQSGLTFNVTDATTSPAEEWYKMSTSGLTATAASPFGGSTIVCPQPPEGSFIIDTRNVRFVDGSSATLQPSITHAQLEYGNNDAFVASGGLWVEPIRSAVSSDPNQANIGYIDFHIRACWEGSGLGTPMTTGTIVRLYEPRG